MTTSGLSKKLAFLYGVVMLPIDGYFLVSYGRNAAADIGWWYIAGAALTQVFVLVASLIVLANKDRLLYRGETAWPMDSFRKMSCAIIFVGVTLGFSIALLQVGIVCPELGLPRSRGVPICSPTSGHIDKAVGGGQPSVQNSLLHS